MSTVHELLATDDTFREVADLLFGGGADELIAKMNPDQADLATKKKNRERTEARIGLATNIVGIGAGAAATPPAIKAVGQKYREAKGLPPKEPKPSRMGKLKSVQSLKATAKKPGVALGLAGAAAGLQVANLGGDFVANRVLSRSAKKDPNVKGGTLTAVRETKKKVDAVHKSEVKNNVKEVRHAMTRATVASGKGIAGLRKGVYRKLPAGQKGTAKVEKRDEVDVIWEGEFAKADEEKQQVFGWASVVEVNGEPVVDLQGDIISVDEMEKAGYSYVMKSRKGGDMHLRDNWAPVQKSEMIESFIVTPEKREAMGLPDNVPSGWWVGFQVQDPDVWAKVKSGERTGFSIHGHGKRSPG